MKNESKSHRPRLQHLFVAYIFVIYLSLLSDVLTPKIIAKEIEGRRPLEHSDYDLWNTISNQRLSPDGQWVMYTLQSGKKDGDPTVVIRDLNSSREFSILRGAGARFTYDSKYVIFRVEPDKQTVKNLKKKKTKPTEMPTAQMVILNLKSGKQFSVDRVKSFSVAEENGRWLAYHLLKPNDNDTAKQSKSKITETYEVTPEGLKRPAKPIPLKKRKSIENLRHQEIPGNEQIKSSNKETEQQETKQQPEKQSNKEEKQANTDSSEKPKEKTLGTTLVVRNLDSGNEWRYPGVTSYVFSKSGNAIAFATSLDDGKRKPAAKNINSTDDNKTKDQNEPSTGNEVPESKDGVFVFNLDKTKTSKIVSGLGNYRQLRWNEKGNQLAFITDRDDYQSKTPAWELYLWNSENKDSQLVAAESTKGVPNGWWIASTTGPYFSEDGRRLFFNTAPIPKAVLKERAESKKSKKDETNDDIEDKEPKAKLDIWHWQDPLLQPQQLIQAEQERKRSYLARFDLRNKNVVQLATKAIPFVAIDRRSSSNFAAAFSNYRYQKQMSWDLPGKTDTFLVNLKTGKRELLIEGARSNGSMSPEGKFVTWWDAEKKSWFAVSTGKNRDPVEISSGINFPLENELHDTPSLPRPYGIAGWLKKDKGVLIYDRFDLWLVDLSGEAKPQCVTNGFGRERQIRFRYLRLDSKLRAIDPKLPVLLSAFNQQTKASGFYRLELQKKKDADNSESTESKLEQLIMLDESLSRPTLAEKSDRIIFRRSTFRKCPDLWAGTLEFKKIKRISNINPQQDDYTWGTVELTKWKATDGKMLEGLLYKPDGFDPKHKYPMMVYFYERNSDNLHRYSTPATSRSIINFSFYVSRGYVLFVPDIPYKTGEPGPSAANSVISGVQHIVSQGFVDKSRIGMQGHSWGGYQTAYLVTQTDMFACAESGAPVSNMTSAYGGIRWGSGMSRMFQYERTQSRIGSDLWSARQKYIANSPLFFADKINTPLLILHNDEDGAVPWYQGIELFVAMRRLEKPSWLLNYNGEPHWVMKDENQIDFTIRMQQFFDHNLKDAPEPEWMAVGVPAVEKGENFGLELLEPKEQKTENNLSNNSIEEVK